MNIPVLLAKNWWSLMLRGIVAIGLGCVLMGRPELPGTHLGLLFGGYAIVDGLIALAGAVRAAESHQRWAELLAEGVTGIGAGIAVFAWPAATPLHVFNVIAGWALITGILEMIAAVRLRQYVCGGEWLMGLSAVASLLLGALMIAAPLVGRLKIALWLGIYGFVFGFLLIGLAFQLRAWALKQAAQGSPGAPGRHPSVQPAAH